MLFGMEGFLDYLVQDWRDILAILKIITRNTVLKLLEELLNELREVRKETFAIEPKSFSIRYIHIIRIIQDTVPKLAASGFSKFRKRNRPPSSTMPWTIWPSLVVLWGVCWMFYNPLNSAEGEQFEPLFLETDTTLHSIADPGINRSTLLKIFKYANKPLQKSISSQPQYRFCPIMALSTA